MDADPLLIATTIDRVEGAVDYHGRPVSRSTSGGWTSARYLIGVEIAEKFASGGIVSNLISYLTGPLGESTASAASNVNLWCGAALMLPVLGGFFADSYLGQYRTIFSALLLYLLGLGMLTLSATAPPLRPTQCSEDTACSPTTFQVVFFFCSMYMVAFAQGGYKPCVQAFGADQFDENDSEECKSKSSFFNWWFFALCGGNVASTLVLNYIQDNMGWGLGFGVSFMSMALSLVFFLLGTKTYRYYVTPKKGLFRHTDGTHSLKPDELDGKAAAKGVLRLFPIWATCLIYGVVFAQSSTFFTKQASTMDRRIGSTLQIPSAALQSFIFVSIVTFIPIYDRILVPVARNFTQIPSGITMLQRIGIGLFLSAISMVIAALVESKRLKTARDLGLIDLPNVAIPMSLCWLVPQYVLLGISDVFAVVGLGEFFYDQVPDGLRSLGISLYFSIFGFGSFISSFLVSLIDKATGRSGDSWLSDNLNRAHLDYFYWLLAGVSTVGSLVYLSFAVSFRYNKKGNVIV